MSQATYRSIITLKIFPDQLTAEQYLLTMESCNEYIRFRCKKSDIGSLFLLINGL